MTQAVLAEIVTVDGGTERHGVQNHFFAHESVGSAAPRGTHTTKPCSQFGTYTTGSRDVPLHSSTTRRHHLVCTHSEPAATVLLKSIIFGLRLSAKLDLVFTLLVRRLETYLVIGTLSVPMTSSIERSLPIGWLTGLGHISGHHYRLDG